MRKLAIETVVPVLVGYVLFRCGRGAVKVLRQVFVEFVSG